MNRIEELELENQEIEKKVSEYYKSHNFNVSMDEYRKDISPLQKQQDQNEIEIKRLKNQSVQVGDGITIDLWSDSHAYTIIKRTPKTITIQRDEATLSKDFKPEWIPGGFAGHCVNQNEQRWTYERNPNGEVRVLHWSDKLNGWKTEFGYKARLGRHEFYDYNF